MALVQGLRFEKLTGSSSRLQQLVLARQLLPHCSVCCSYTVVVRQGLLAEALTLIAKVRPPLALIWPFPRLPQSKVLVLGARL